MAQVDTNPTTDVQGIGMRRVLKAGLRKWFFVFAIGAVFVAIGVIWIVTENALMAWGTTLFFGLVAAIALAQVVGVGSRLELDIDSFELVNFGRRTRERWDETASFAVYRVSQSTMVGYDRARDVDTHIGHMNRAVSGRSAGLPDTFGMKAEALAGLMNAYQALGVARSWERHNAAVARVRDDLDAEFAATGRDVDIVSDQQMKLPDGMTAWPSLLVIDRSASDPAHRILACIDILSPVSRWVTEATKRRDAFEGLGAAELRIQDGETGEARRISREEL